MKLRQCEKSDIKVIYNFSKKDLKFDEWFSLKFLNEVFAKNKETCFVLDDKDKVIGAYFVADEFNGRAWTWFVAIDPKYRKLGLGKKIVNVVAKKLKTMGFYRLYSDTELSNTSAINFHLKIGFRIDGIFSDWYGPGHHSIIFSRELVK
jgi:ribosomal protein S18 acetylase RimI-like enzyme